MIKNIFLLYILFVFPALYCLSQGYLVHHYTEAEGLPTEYIHDITQDLSGRVWLATHKGIAVYDGASWQTCLFNNGYPTTAFYRIHADQKGRIWALSFNSGGFVVMKHHIGKPLNVNHWETFIDSRKANELQSHISDWKEISSFNVIDPDTSNEPDLPIIAIGTTTHGVFIWNRGKWNNINETDGLLSNKVNCAAFMTGKLFVATENGLSLIPLNSYLPAKVDNRLNDLLVLPSKEILSLGIQYSNQYPDSSLTHSRVWLYGNEWLGYFDENSPKTTIYPARSLATDGDRLIRLVPDYRCGIYICNPVTLLYYNFDTSAWQTLRSYSGLKCSGGNSLLVDFEKNIWIACDRGLDKISSRRFSNYQMIHGLSGDEVTAILEYKPGNFILGHNTGFTFYDGNHFFKVPLAHEEEKRHVSIRVLDIRQDSKGDIWAAVSWGGLINITAHSPHTISWLGKEHGLPAQVNTLWIESDNNKKEHIWVGSTTGVFYSEGGLENPRFKFKDTGISPIPKVRRMFDDPGNPGKMCYLATSNNGVEVYDRQKLKWTNLNVPGNSRGNNIFSLVKHSNGNLYVGTIDGFYVKDNQELRKFVSNGFRLDRPVFFIVEDLKQRLWLGTDNGVVRWDGTEARYYTTEDGLVGHETNRAAGILDHSGNIWIGTNTGLSVYNEAFDDNTIYNPQPKLQVISLETSDRLIPLTDSSPIELSHKENTITMNFRGISLYNERSNRFMYFLEGFDNQWQVDQKLYKHTIRYSNLPSGKYRFHIKMVNARRKWSDEAVSPIIVIRHPFYLQWWFLGLSVLFVGSIFYMLFRYFYERRYATLLEKQVEERSHQLKTVEQRYRRLFEDSMDVVYITTPDGKLIDINPAGVVALGYQSIEELMKLESIEQLYVNPEDREKMRKEMEARGFIKEYEVSLKRKDGELLIAVLTATVETDNEGDIIAYRGIARDITEKKKLEEELIQARKMEAIGTLAGGIAHDFNNILAVIMGQGELICDEFIDGVNKTDQATLEWISKSARHIVNAADRGAELVRQILTFSRQSKRERKPIDLTVIIKDSLSLLRSILPVTIDIRQKITPSSQYVLADATQIRQIMLNFGTNAAHAMREKGGILEVSLDEIYLDEESIKQFHELKPGVYLKLVVRDTGHGMPPEIKKRIFDPYFTTKKTGEGTGMGLSVIHGIVKSHNGDISVLSEPDKGTTFQVILPCVAENYKKAIVQENEEIPGGNEHILLVDDEELLVNTIAHLLEKIGYSVYMTTDPKKAIEIFKQHPDQFDLVISDVTMPRMTGIQLSKELKHISPTIPIILCSGFKSALSVGQLKQLGINHYVMKPINRLNLAKTIRTILDNPSSD